MLGDVGPEEQISDDAKSEENTRDEYKERGGVIKLEKGRQRSRKLAMPSVRYRPGSCQGPRLSQSEHTPHLIHATAISAKNRPVRDTCSPFETCVSGRSAPYRVVHNRCIDKHCPRTVVAGWTRNRCIHMHDLHSVNRAICITRLPIKCSIADHLVLRLMQSNLCHPSLLYSRMKVTPSA
jgi:hypothetical protein